MLNTKLNRNSILFVNLNNLKCWNPRSALIIWGSVQNKTNVAEIDKVMFYVQTCSEESSSTYPGVHNVPHVKC